MAQTMIERVTTLEVSLQALIERLEISERQQAAIHEQLARLIEKLDRRIDEIETLETETRRTLDRWAVGLSIIVFILNAFVTPLVTIWLRQLIS